MKGFKKIFIGTVGVLGLSMILGACSDNAGSEMVISNGKVNITEGDTLKGLVNNLGPENVRKSLLYDLLNSYYKITDKDITTGKEKLNGIYADMGGLESFMNYYGYDEEQLDTTIKNELLLVEGFKDLRGYKEEELVALYEGMKNSKEVIEIVITEETELSKKVLDSLATADNINDLNKLAGDELNKSIHIKNMNYIKGQAEAEYGIVFDTAVGKVITVKNVEGNYVSNMKVMKDVVLKLDDIRTSLEYELLYKDLEDPELWLFAKLVEEKKIKFGKGYEELEGDNAEAIEALSKLGNMKQEIENEEKSKTDKE